MARRLFEDDTQPKVKPTSPPNTGQPPAGPPAPPPSGTGRVPPNPPIRVTEKRRSGGRWLLWLTILFLLLIIGLLSGLLSMRPDLVGLMRIADWQSTNVGVLSTVSILEATSIAQQQRDINLLNTQVSLDNYSALLGQTETQQVINDFSTLTAVAVNSELQATRAAENFAATQAALQQLSTQVQQEFLATQAAISGSLATIQANQPQQNILIVDGDFVRGTESINSASPSPVWAVSDTGALIAQAANSTVLTRRSSYPQQFTVNIGLVAGSTSSYYDVLLGMNRDTNTGSLLRIYHDSTQVTSVSLYAIDFARLNQPDGILVDDNQALVSAQSLNLPGRDIAVMISINGQDITVEVNGTPALQTKTPTPSSAGSIGVQLRSGAQLQVLQVLSGAF